MKTQIAPMLAVSDGNAAIAFYRAAFGATVLWHLDGGGHIVAGLEIDGAPFFLAHESPPHGTRSPASAGFTTVRIELFVDDPVAVHKQALAAGAIDHSPVREHTHTVTGPRPIGRMLQGAVVDPFGHLWLVGKFLATDNTDNTDDTATDHTDNTDNTATDHTDNTDNTATDNTDTDRVRGMASSPQATSNPIPPESV